MFVGFNLISGIRSWWGWLVEAGPDFLWFGRSLAETFFGLVLPFTGISR
jgi:hypothetical protein